jgi:trans-aconitate 2-methyltransferase
MSSEAPKTRAASTRWDPQQYLKFSDHRLRPALELLGRVPLASPVVVYDLGCGAGNVTKIIAERWPSARVQGVDNSKEMLAKSASQSAKIEWVEADAGTWSPDAPADMIYSNAALHWIGDHRTLFPRLLGFLNAGGCLAVQMPMSWDSPSHRLMRETLKDGATNGTAFGTEELRRAADRKWVLEPEIYYELLAGRTATLDIWTTEYFQVLEGDDAVLEWVKGTGLRPILDGLERRERESFVAEYARRLRLAYPIGKDGRTLYPFERLFIVATV